VEEIVTPQSSAGAKRKLVDHKAVLLFWWVMWIAYTLNYYGRYNFIACISDMSVNHGYSKSALGMMAAVLFLSYGIGQLLSGILGERFSPVWLVFVGIEASACFNLLFAFQNDILPMTIIIALNGFAQSLTWPPIVRLCADRLTSQQCAKTCVNMFTAAPAGMLVTFALCAVLVRRFSWRACFVFAFCIVSCAACLWVIGMKRAEYLAEKDGVLEEHSTLLKQPEAEAGSNGRFMAIILSSGLLLMVAATWICGLLKEGISTWMPTFLAEKFQVSASASIGLTMVLPGINLAGIFLAKYVNQRFFQNEMKTASIFFGFTMMVVLCIIFAGETSIVLAIILLTAVVSAMSGTAVLFAGLVPLYFKDAGRVSTIVGMLNSSASLGSASASLLLGSIADRIGWGGNYLIWIISSGVGATVCILCIRRWKCFLAKQSKAAFTR